MSALQALVSPPLHEAVVYILHNGGTLYIGLLEMKLFLKACGVKRVLISDIKWKRFNHFFIGKLKHLFDDQSPNDNINWCVVP